MNPISVNSSYNNFYNPYQQYGSSQRVQTPYYEESNTNTADSAAKNVGLLALLQVAASGLQKLSGWCSAKLMGGEEFATSQNVKKVADHMVNKNKLNVMVDYLGEGSLAKYANADPGLLKELEVVAKGQNAFYADGLKLAVAPEKKPSLMLHELGHAVNAQKTTFMKMLQKARKFSHYAPMAILLGSYLSSGKNDKPNFIERNAGVLGFASFLPTIIEEGAASLKGIKAAKTVLGKTAKLGILKRNYFLAWMTYLLAGVGVGIAAKATVVSEKRL